MSCCVPRFDADVVHCTPYSFITQMGEYHDVRDVHPNAVWTYYASVSRHVLAAAYASRRTFSSMRVTTAS